MTSPAVEPAAVGGEGGAPEPGHDRMGELLQPRAGQPGLTARSTGTRSGGFAGGSVSKHKVKTGKYVRFPDTRLRDEYGLTRLFAEDQGPSACEGMISSESRMREIRTSGLMSGDWKRGHGSRTEARCESAGQATGP